MNGVVAPEKVATDIVASNGSAPAVARPVNGRLAWLAVPGKSFRAGDVVIDAEPLEAPDHIRRDVFCHVRMVGPERDIPVSQ